MFVDKAKLHRLGVNPDWMGETSSGGISNTKRNIREAFAANWKAMEMIVICNNRPKGRLIASGGVSFSALSCMWHPLGFYCALS